MTNILTKGFYPFVNIYTNKGGASIDRHTAFILFTSDQLVLAKAGL